MLTAILLAPLAVLLGQVLARDGLAVVPTATVVGILAAVMHFLGLARWPFLVPGLARTYHDPASSQATREATVVIFESFHRYLGVAVGECLGYLFTGAWTLLVGVAMLQSFVFEAWLALPGIAIGLVLVAGSLEFVGRFEEGLETRTRARPDRLYRLVALANRRRARTPLRVTRIAVPSQTCMSATRNRTGVPPSRASSLSRATLDPSLSR
jgi:hypothetical protein